MNMIGIELNQTCIKSIEVKKQKQKLILQKGRILEIDSQDNQDISVKWLQRVMNLKSYPKKKLVIVINKRQVIVRQLLISQISERTIQQQLEIKPDIYLPIERGTHQIRFKLLPTLEKEKTLLQLVAVPNTIVYDAIYLAKKIKGRLMKITVPSEALATLFLDIGRGKQNHLIIDIGKEITQIFIIESNGGYLMKYIHFGAKDLQVLAQGYFKETYQTIDNVIQYLYLQIHESIIVEIESLLKFYRTRYQRFEIQEFYLISQEKIIENIKLKDYLSRTLNIKWYPIDFIQSKIDDIAPFLYLVGAIIGANP